MNNHEENHNLQERADNLLDATTLFAQARELRDAVSRLHLDIIEDALTANTSREIRLIALQTIDPEIFLDEIDQILEEAENIILAERERMLQELDAKWLANKTFGRVMIRIATELSDVLKLIGINKNPRPNQNFNKQEVETKLTTAITKLQEIKTKAEETAKSLPKSPSSPKKRVA